MSRTVYFKARNKITGEIKCLEVEKNSEFEDFYDNILPSFLEANDVYQGTQAKDINGNQIYEKNILKNDKDEYFLVSAGVVSGLKLFALDSRKILSLDRLFDLSNKFQIVGDLLIDELPSRYKNLTISDFVY